tara:strand:- start:628 stop:1101 length:474 start_codon:yes stop_codon:yes gene_type:complete
MNMYIVRLIALLFIIGGPAQAQFFSSDHTVKDVTTGVTWLRCSVGQAWDPSIETCTGEIVKINHDEIAIALKQAKEQLGGVWRLPTREELVSLVCDDCGPPKINSKYFPKLSSEAYWTGDKNWMNPRTYWTVNFMTGHTYNRFFPYQRLPVLLVKGK